MTNPPGEGVKAMTFNILAVGDVSGTAGLNLLTQKLHGIQKLYDIDFTVVNAENAHGLGVSASQAQEILNAGADVITLGNHTWSRYDIIPFLDDCGSILRPSNFAPQAPGRGWGVFETVYGDVCVINLIGRVDIPIYSENPFFEIDTILKKTYCRFVLVDFHAEATSEKLAMAYYLDGRVSAMWGTHTHVQTSDYRVFPKRMGYITDLGMTGALESVIGMDAKSSISRFLGNPPGKFEVADGPSKLEGAVFSLDIKTGKCLSVEAIRIMEEKSNR